ncbi:phosphoinositide 3-kinase regulatory subunit 4 [Delitschia confertaspora ATCC 74209]|uniref:Phosphoinositide 3-kinase regulatory subunit 4 n=1 Tax=Delitschia confertaspora ATCC 74209 TaxID=1513339 RepID=A0A9P4JLQ9_9PLEO|nr:phosphoinositide 3-kinase regulatory subunit 4 [Delitschia confertaspora ATCC 74209]
MSTLNLAPDLTRPDYIVLQRLAKDFQPLDPNSNHSQDNGIDADIKQLSALNDSSHKQFEPTVFVTWDLSDLRLRFPTFTKYVLKPYIEWGRTVVRAETDVVMLTHLILYFTTLVPSAIYLFYQFAWWHGVAHWVMQSYYVGTYTLMMHQHIHMRGILAPKYKVFDRLFPYITDPLMGHTWNSYFYHHVKHHHVEANGPDDLSSTIRYQRDELSEFLKYLGRFFFLVWFDLPCYFLRKNQPVNALKAGGWEIGTLVSIATLAWYNFRPTLFTLILPLFFLRIGLMVGNWGQHAFVDEEDPNSDFRSSITLIDVASNRYCYNDGYHTSHHLNPLRHWREHPVAFLKQKDTYANEKALVFYNIDYIMVTVSLLRKDYMRLARCLVPMGDQVGMTLEERAEMLRGKTRAFGEEEVRRGFGKAE